MKKFLLFIFILCFVISSNISARYVVGYYYLWSRSSYPYTAVEYKNLTHIIHAFIAPTNTGELSVESSFLYPELIQRAHENGVKVLVGLGGFGNSDGFSPMVADTNYRKKFISNLVAFCKKNGYDGADIDWEYPKTADNANLVKLISEMRTAFDAAGIQYISAALPSTDWQSGFNITALRDKMDWFGIMTYDFTGPWEAAAYFNSPLYSSSQQSGSIDNSVKYFTGKGMPKNKLLIGTPFYGYNLKAKAPYAAHTKNEGVSIIYPASLQKIAEGWEYHWDETTKVPYLQDKAHTQFISFDDTNSVKYKSDYVVRNGLQGTIIWELRQDYNGTAQPLLRTIGSYMLNPPTAAPASPAPELPENGKNLDTTSVSFKWKTVYPAVWYNFQMSYDSLFTTLLANRTQVTFGNITINGLTKGKKYFWRVAASNSAGSSQWSEPKSFVITDKTVAVRPPNPEVTVPEEFRLENYPNPFNPITRIRYTMPAEGNVTLQVFDIIGKKIRTLIDNEPKSAGVHEVEFDGSGLTSGIYFYQLHAGSTILTRKMVLNK
ncbi:MAG: glycosyl hydrolase family 18 protein [Bacteroidota bacterium]